MAHQPMEPSAFDISSIALNAVRGSSSGPPIDRGRNICKSPAAARAFATRSGTRRICSPSSRATRISGTRLFAAATRSTGSGKAWSPAAISALSFRCVFPVRMCDRMPSRRFDTPRLLLFALAISARTWRRPTPDSLPTGSPASCHHSKRCDGQSQGGQKLAALQPHPARKGLCAAGSCRPGAGSSCTAAGSRHTRAGSCRTGTGSSRTASSSSRTASRSQGCPDHVIFFLRPRRAAEPIPHRRRRVRNCGTDREVEQS
jgi:hypothetical protein